MGLAGCERGRARQNLRWARQYLRWARARWAVGSGRGRWAWAVGSEKRREELREVWRREEKEEEKVRRRRYLYSLSEWRVMKREGTLYIEGEGSLYSLFTLHPTRVVAYRDNTPSKALEVLSRPLGDSIVGLISEIVILYIER
jgi:hypothetical protein